MQYIYAFIFQMDAIMHILVLRYVLGRSGFSMVLHLFIRMEGLIILPMWTYPLTLC